MATPRQRSQGVASIKVGPPHRASCLVEGDGFASHRGSLGKPSIDAMPFDHNFFLTNHARKGMMAKLASSTSTNPSQYEKRNTRDGKFPSDTDNDAHRAHEVHGDKKGRVIFPSVASSPSSSSLPPRVLAKVTNDIGLPVLRSPASRSPPHSHSHPFPPHDTRRKSSSSSSPPCRAYPSLSPLCMSVSPMLSPRRIHYEELYRQGGSCQEVTNKSHGKQEQPFVRPEELDHQIKKEDQPSNSNILALSTTPLKFTPRAPRVSAPLSSSSKSGSGSATNTAAVTVNKEDTISSSSLSFPNTRLNIQHVMKHSDTCNEGESDESNSGGPRRHKGPPSQWALTHQWSSTQLSETERERRAAISLAESTQRVSLHRFIKYALDREVWPLRMRLLEFREEPKARGDNVTLKEMHERRVLQGGFAAGLAACAQAEAVTIAEREMFYGRKKDSSLGKVYDVSSSPCFFSSAAPRDHNAKGVDARTTALANTNNNNHDSSPTNERDKKLVEQELSGDWREVHPQLYNTLILITVQNCVNDEARRRKFLEVRDEPSAREMIYALFTEELSTTVEAKRATRRHLERIETYQGSNRSFYEGIAMRIIAEDVFMEELIEREALYRRFLFSTCISSSSSSSKSPSRSLFDDCNEKTDADFFDAPETISAAAANEESDDTHEVHVKGSGEEGVADCTATSGPTTLALPEAEARRSITYRMITERRCIECHALIQYEATGRELSEISIGTQSAPRRAPQEYCRTCKCSACTKGAAGTWAADGLNNVFDDGGDDAELCVRGSRLSILEEECKKRGVLVLGTLLLEQESIHRIGLVREYDEFISVTAPRLQAGMRQALVAELARHHACLAIQRWVRAVRMGFRGWRATHRRVGGWCALYRQKKRNDQRRSRDLSGWGGY